MDRQLIIERERNWAAPAATAAILAFILYLVSFAIDRSANLYTGASDARQLASIHDHASTVLIGSLFRAATFLLVPLPFLYLFRAAQARNPRVQAVMLGFIMACRELNATETSFVIKSMIARRIIAHVQRGERNATLLCRRTVEELLPKRRGG